MVYWHVKLNNTDFVWQGSSNSHLIINYVKPGGENHSITHTESIP